MLTRELSTKTFEEKLHIYVRPCVILYLSYKLWYYTWISSPEKSRHNTREKTPRKKITLACYTCLCFHLEPQRQRSLGFLFRDCRFFYFRSLIKLTFLVSEGPITRLLVDMNFLFCSCYSKFKNSTYHSACSIS